MILPQSFYDRPTLKVAQDLLGCFLVRRIDGKIIRTQIVETEAYCGPNDLASHASRGLTPRNSIMFGHPGFIYVYFTYGMHYMLNIVTEAKDYPAAVLIRAVEPVINNHRDEALPARIATRSVSGGPHLYNTSGPAKLTKALKINKSFNGMPIYTKKYGLWIEERVEDLKPSRIVKAARIGVDYANEYKDKKWRFYIKRNKYISRL